MHHHYGIKLQAFELLFIILTTLFCSVLVISNAMAAKIFLLPGLNISLPAGLITYPLSFLITDVISEVYGPRRANVTVFLGFAISIVAWGIIQLALRLPPSPDWVSAGNDWGFTSAAAYQNAYASVFELNSFAIGGSMIAYVVAQLVDIRIFHYIRELTGGRHLWLRNNLSTMISQLLDTAIVNTVFLYWGMGLPFSTVVPMTVAAYIYKFIFALADTPLCYLLVRILRQQMPMPCTCPALH